MDAAGLTARLQALCHDDIALCIPDTMDQTPWQAPENALPSLSARTVERQVVTTGG